MHDISVSDLVNATKLVGFVRESVRLALDYRKGKLTTQAQSDAELQSAFDLALRVSGSVLYELRSNVERIRHIVEQVEKKSYEIAPFDFTLADAMMPKLCDILPTPQVLSVLNLTLSAARRVDFFVRTWVSAPIGPPTEQRGPFVYSREDTRARDKAVRLSREALDKGIVNRFNWLVEINRGLGQSVFGEAWSGLADSYGPAPINPEAAVDRSLI